MGIFDFFKKKKQEIEKIKLNEIEEYLENKKKETKKESSDLLINLNNRIFRLINELEKEIKVLEKIDLHEKKAEERVKLIVGENLNNYIIYVYRLIKNMNNLQEKIKLDLTNPNDIIKEVNQILDNFDKRSIMSFEKSTFIIGKELGDVRDSVMGFFEDFKKLIKEHKKTLTSLNLVSLIGIKLKEINNIQESKNKINENLQQIDNKINESIRNNKKIQEEIKKIRKSREFEEELIKKQENEKQKQEVIDEIYSLKQLIDLKLLANIYHSNPKEMQIIKHYNQNFKETFEKTNGEDLLDLISDRDKNKIKISEKISKIIKKQDIIKKTFNLKPSIQQNKIKELESKSEKISSNIEDLNIEKIKEKKRDEKLEENSKDVIVSMKNELVKFGVEVES